MGGREVDGWCGTPSIELKNERFPFHVFLRYGFHIQDFQELFRRISNIFQLFNVQDLHFPKNKMAGNDHAFSWFNLSNLVGPESRIMLFGGR